MKEPKPLIVYHADCMDGLAAAWAASLVHLRVEFLPDQYNAPLPPLERFTGLDVLLVDFSYQREFLLSINEVARSLRVIDHHATARDALADLPFAVFDMNRSGAGLTWDTLHPGKARPWFIDYVEDRDLWRWSLPHSREINAALRTFVRDPRDFDAMLSHSSGDFLIPTGSGILKAQEEYIQSTMKSVRSCVLLGAPPEYSVLVPTVNAPDYCRSELLGELAKPPRTPYAVGWSELPDGRFRYSLRSSPEGLNVTPLALRYGGGGHPRAAGFVVPTLIHRSLGVS